MTLHKFKQICPFSTSNPQCQPSPSVHSSFVHTHICLSALLGPPSSVATVLSASGGGTQVWSDCFPFPKYCAFCLDSTLQVTAHQPPKRARPVRPWLTIPKFYPPSIRHNSLPSFVEHHPRYFKHKTPLFHSLFSSLLLNYNASNLFVYCCSLADLCPTHRDSKGWVLVFCFVLFLCLSVFFVFWVFVF